MIRVLLYLSLQRIFNNVVSATGCGNWISYRDLCFKFYNDLVYWDESIEKCCNLNAVLALPTDNEMNSMFHKNFTATYGMWINIVFHQNST